jgi:type VI secretion system protein ImpJ
MTPLQKVLWTRGTLLSPQHLQTQDGYLDELVDFELSSRHHAPWGFSRLEIDREALAAGSLVVTEADGLFPDGLPFRIPAADPQPSPKPLQAHWRPDQRSLDVFLAVPQRRDGGQNVSLRAEERHTRYLSETVLRRDENTGLAEKPVQLARRNLRLIAQGEAREGQALLQVARVLRGEAGELQLDPRYVPPLLDVSGNPYLLTLARGLVEILSARGSTLAGTRRQRNRGLADFGASDAASFWLLYTVNSHLPVIRHRFEARRGHPEALYRAMLALAGALTTLSESIHPRDLPPYDHDDLGGCFGRLDALLRELLERVVPTNHLTLPLKQTEPLLHATALDDERLLAGSQLFLGVRATTAPDQIARRAPQLLKASSAEQVQRLIRHALPGLPLRFAPVPPGSLPVKLEYQYFQIDRAGPEWDAIRVARNLAVYVPSDFPEAQLELVALLGAGGGERVNG